MGARIARSEARFDFFLFIAATLGLEVLRRPVELTQYASADYRSELAAHGMVCSMSRKGECWDNAVAESFFARLKDDLLYRRKWATKDEAIAAVREYIMCFYNARRLHSSLGYLSPMDYEAASAVDSLAA